jgi:(S)-sulfolactate dehydrogenase
MTDIVIAEFMDQSSVDTLSTHFDVYYSPDLVDQPKLLAVKIANARAIIVRNRTQISQVLLDQAPNLQVLGRLGVGLDNIDIGICKQRDITVYPATGANDIAVAEYVIAATLILARNAYSSTDKVTVGDWPRQGSIGKEIQGQSLGLIGYGSIAREAAKRAVAMGMNIIAFDPFISVEDDVWSYIRRAESIDELLEQADIISLHVPLTDVTRNLIDAKAIRKMKPGVLLINTSRGGVIDESALVEAMKAGHVGGAAIDVFENEPVDENAGKQFNNIPNLLLTPHIAGVTEQSNIRVSSMIAGKIMAHLRGEQNG